MVPEYSIQQPEVASDASVHLDGLFVSSLMLQIQKANRFYCAKVPSPATTRTQESTPLSEQPCWDRCAASCIFPLCVTMPTQPILGGRVCWPLARAVAAAAQRALSSGEL